MEEQNIQQYVQGQTVIRTLLYTTYILCPGIPLVHARVNSGDNATPKTGQKLAYYTKYLKICCTNLHQIFRFW